MFFCTYFDKNYASRALACITSLQKYVPHTVIFAVCLDKESLEIVKHLQLKRVQAVDVAVIESSYPELRTAKKNRTTKEYYWTLTSVVNAFFLQKLPPDEVLFYSDADIFFYSSPACLLEEMRDASVLIHRHNFPDSEKHLEVNGIYNVGIMAFRHDADGLRVLQWWKERCLEYCGDKIITDAQGKLRYGDQKYLESFFDISPRVRVCQNPGLGVAPWNQARYTLGLSQEGQPTVDGVPVICYHFHSFFQFAPAGAVPAHAHYRYSLDSLKLFSLPYLCQLDATLAALRKTIPDTPHGFRKDCITPDTCIILHNAMADAFREAGITALFPLDGEYLFHPTPRLAEYADFATAPLLPQGWAGDFADWQSATAHAQGYDAPHILHKHIEAARAVRDGKALWERDSVLFYHREYRQPLLEWLLQIAEDQGSLHVLDFGGALGSTYMQHKAPFAFLGDDFSWSVVEQKHFAEAGRAEFCTKALHFYENVEAALAAHPVNTLLLSSVLQYLEEPFEQLERLSRLGIPHIILDRLTLYEGRNRLTLQTVPESIYKASYPSWFFDSQQIENVLKAHGYTCGPWFSGIVDPPGHFGCLRAEKGITKVSIVQQ